ncbi:polysaccharide export protein [bacterium]|jgi:polysaccharide biosynthesis/export protein|nr:polysaccharide export protein [bacterium]
MRALALVRRGALAAFMAALSMGSTGCFKCFACFHKPCQAMDVCKTDAVPRELDKVSGPEYVVEPPDIIYVEGLNTLPTQPLVGEKLVRPDGTINLGFYGDLHVAGLTLSEIEAKIEERLRHYVKNPRVHVDMAAFNSKVFYVVGQVVQPGRVPWTGNETVLDAIMLAGGVTNFTNKCDIRLVRPTPECGCDIVLPVDYSAIINCGDTTTNYQILPGDRLVVPSTVGFEAAVFLDNFLTPVERVFGFANLVRISTINYNTFRR